MKHLKDIVLSGLLSLVIVVMGAGVPFVQYRCQDCAKAGRYVALVDMAEVVSAACDCGCAKHKASARKCCCCATGSGQMKGSGQAKAGGPGSCATGGCAKVRIERISVPTLSTAQQVAQPLPTTIHADYVLCDVPSVASLGADGPTTVPSNVPLRCHPRSRLITFCTLLL